MALNKIEGPFEGNAEPRFFEAGRKQVAEKTSPPQAGKPVSLGTEGKTSFPS
jgi:hypothetical protein